VITPVHFEILFCEESSAGMHDTGDLSAAPRRGARRWEDELATHPIGDRNDHNVSRLDGSAHSAAPQEHRLHPWVSGQRSPSQAHDHGIDIFLTVGGRILSFSFSSDRALCR